MFEKKKIILEELKYPRDWGDEQKFEIQSKLSSVRNRKKVSPNSVLCFKS